MTTICSQQDTSATSVHLNRVGGVKPQNVPLLALVHAYAHQLVQWLERMREQRESRDAFSHLLKLDDALLEDIGVTRADVERAAKLPLAQDAAQVLNESAGRIHDQRA